MTENIPTGVPGLDSILGGFRVGDNVIIENSVSAPPGRLLDALMRHTVSRGNRVFYFSFDASPHALRQRLRHLPEVVIVDCFTFGHGGQHPTAAGGVEEGIVVVRQPHVPGEVRTVMDQLSENDDQSIFVVDSLNGMAMLWGGEGRVAAFYAHMCPRLFDLGNVAVWVLHEGVQTTGFHAQIGHIAQVVLALGHGNDGLRLAVRRATGRPHAQLGVWYGCMETPDGLSLVGANDDQNSTTGPSRSRGT